MHEKQQGDFVLPIEEGAPLLSHSSYSNGQPRGNCTRGVFCKRCVSGAHKNSRKRTMVRTGFIAILVAWLYWSVLGHPGFTGGFLGGHHDDQCRKNLVPWNGPSKIVTSASNLEVKFGKGNLVTTVQVLTGDVSQPTVIIRANVSTPYGHHPGDNDNDHDDVVGTTETLKNYEDHGLHLEFREYDGQSQVYFWADEHYGHHYQERFCGNIDVDVVLPKNLTEFGRLAVLGTLLKVTTHDIGAIAFEKVELSSTVGSILVDSLVADSLVSVLTNGPIDVKALTAPLGAPLKAKLSTTVGQVVLVATATVLGDDYEGDGHAVDIRTTTGDIHLHVGPEQSKKSSHGVPGDIHVTTSTDVGLTANNIDLADGQLLFLRSKSTTGTIDSTVSDKFLGQFSLKTDIGTATVVEAEDSASEIEYQKNNPRVKIGRKFIKTDDGEIQQGEIAASSDFGRALLTFV
ncbi:MAG: hypothetical protein BYD32DRAFT_484246 [Podila humilis]|nr:MAG: hypothetical protein BYD32DRAFT_484246 [Podila humilis]